MFKAIETKFHGPGAVKGSRISVRAVDNNAKFFDYDHMENHERRHASAAKAYAEFKGWPGLYIAGFVKGAGYVFVNAGTDIRPSSIAGFSLDNHPLGFEGVDWFYVAPLEKV